MVLSLFCAPLLCLLVLRLHAVRAAGPAPRPIHFSFEGFGAYTNEDDQVVSVQCGDEFKSRGFEGDWADLQDHPIYMELSATDKSKLNCLFNFASLDGSNLVFNKPFSVDMKGSKLIKLRQFTKAEGIEVLPPKFKVAIGCNNADTECTTFDKDRKPTEDTEDDNDDVDDDGDEPDPAPPTLEENASEPGDDGSEPDTELPFLQEDASETGDDDNDSNDDDGEKTIPKPPQSPAEEPDVRDNDRNGTPQQKETSNEKGGDAQPTEKNGESEVGKDPTVREVKALDNEIAEIMKGIDDANANDALEKYIGTSIPNKPNETVDQKDRDAKMSVGGAYDVGSEKGSSEPHQVVRSEQPRPDVPEYGAATNAPVAAGHAENVTPVKHRDPASGTAEAAVLPPLVEQPAAPVDADAVPSGRKESEVDAGKSPSAPVATEHAADTMAMKPRDAASETAEVAVKKPDVGQPVASGDAAATAPQRRMDLVVGEKETPAASVTPMEGGAGESSLRALEELPEKFGPDTQTAEDAVVATERPARVPDASDSDRGTATFENAGDPAANRSPGDVDGMGSGKTSGTEHGKTETYLPPYIITGRIHYFSRPSQDIEPKHADLSLSAPTADIKATLQSESRSENTAPVQPLPARNTTAAQSSAVTLRTVQELSMPVFMILSASAFIFSFSF